MTRGEACKVRCPKCGWWIAKITSSEAEVEISCVNWNCQVSLVICRENGTITVNVIEKKVKQA